MSEPRLTVLRAADRKPSRWKNGGGMTTEIAVSPEGASLESFDWRVSIATVEADGPFSLFPDVDRCCLVLEGVLLLQVGEAPPITLNADSPSFAFPGDCPVRGTVLDGPVTDLNVFVRRARRRGSVERLSWRGTRDICVTRGTALILLRGADGQFSCNSRPLGRLLRHDAVRIDAAADHVLQLKTAALADSFLIRLPMPEA